MLASWIQLLDRSQLDFGEHVPKTDFSFRVVDPKSFHLTAIASYQIMIIKSYYQHLAEYISFGSL